VHVLISYLYFKCEINVNKKIHKKEGVGESRKRERGEREKEGQRKRG
jgi:hypothetical protein